jgi:hypothetical protein
MTSNELIRKLDSFFKSENWLEVLNESFGFEDKSVKTKKSYLPLVLVKSKIFGRKLVSLPFTGDIGGLIGDEEDLEIKAFFANSQEKIRIKTFMNNTNYPHYRISEDRIFLLDLNKSKEEIWDGLDKKVRNIIRKAETFNLSFEVASDEKALKDFYKIYLKKVKNFKSLPMPKNFLLNILKKYGKNVHFLSCLYNKKKVASFFIINFEDVSIWYLAGSLDDHKDKNVSSWLLWNTILWLKKNNFNLFCLGVSRENSGSYNFKKKWKTIAMPVYEIFIPEDNPRDNSSRKISKRFFGAFPIPIMRLLSPLLIKKNLP